jgi:eukaryotic-like serine/threonine-protein kinase
VKIAGDRLGPYEVSGSLGGGGMGEVYRARDPRLGRDVAIKVLPAEVSGDSSRVKRFEREARSASALNHPNIVTIYDTGADLGTSWIAMELVEGQTLRQLASTGPMPMKKLLAAQIAEGLARAHEVGIVHRDLKPENVMVTRDGLVKILDFGLAKLTGPVSESGEQSHLPTVTGTSPGVVMGTVGYMSPEQAAGTAVDYRSDQFALGSILYEMTTGRRAFEKKTAVDTLSAILNEEPEPIATAAPQTPAPVRWIVERCLAKEPRQRYASTEDLAADLANASSRAKALEATPGGEKVAISPRLARWGAVVAVAALLAGALALARFRPRPTAEVRFQQITFQRGGLWRARFTPDGQSVVYAMQSIGADLAPPKMYSVRVGSMDVTTLGVPTADIASVSSSGRLAIILTRPGMDLAWGMGTLADAPMSGGTPRQLLENVNGADWSPDGKSLAVTRFVEGQGRLEYPIGTTLLDSKGIGYPRVSPDGRLVAFLEWPPNHPAVIRVVDRSRKVTTLVDEAGGNGGAAWSADGSEVWWLKVQHHDELGRIQSSEVHASSLGGRDRMILRLPGDYALHDVSREGRLLLEHSEQNFEMLVHAGDGTERSLAWLDQSIPVALSADGRTLLFADRGDAAGNESAAYLRTMDGAAAVRLGSGIPVALSPDGKWVLAVRGSGGGGTMITGTTASRLVLLPTGAGQERPLPQGKPVFAGWAAFHPDGKRIFLWGVEPGHRPRGYVQSLEGGEPVPVTPEGMAPFLLSPDGSQLMIQKDDDGSAAVVPSEPGSQVAPRPVAGMEITDSTVRWSADGRSILVWRPDTRPIEVDRIDLATGRRSPWKFLSPGGLLGSGGLKGLVVSANEDVWVATYNRLFSELIVIDGLN